MCVVASTENQIIKLCALVCFWYTQLHLSLFVMCPHKWPALLYMYMELFFKTVFPLCFVHTMIHIWCISCVRVWCRNLLAIRRNARRMYIQKSFVSSNLFVHPPVPSLSISPDAKCLPALSRSSPGRDRPSPTHCAFRRPFAWRASRRFPPKPTSGRTPSRCAQRNRWRRWWSSGDSCPARPPCNPTGTRDGSCGSPRPARMRPRWYSRPGSGFWMEIVGGKWVGVTPCFQGIICCRCLNILTCRTVGRPTCARHCSPARWRSARTSSGTWRPRTRRSSATRSSRSTEPGWVSRNTATASDRNST